MKLLIRQNIAFTGVMVAWIAAFLATTSSVSGSILYLNEFGSWCGTGTASAQLNIYFAAPIFLGFSYLGYGLCRWIGIWKEYTKFPIMISTTTVLFAFIFNTFIFPQII